MLRDHGVLFNLAGIDQSVFSVSGIESDLQSIVDFLRQTAEQLAGLRQLVLSKSRYLTTSFDIYMLYATYKSLFEMRSDLLKTAQDIVEQKLSPLRGFQNLELSGQPVQEGSIR